MPKWLVKLARLLEELMDPRMGPYPPLPGDCDERRVLGELTAIRARFQDYA